MTHFKGSPCFTKFTADIADIELPEKFTFPFYYRPHPLSERAAKELQEHLMHQTDWHHDFGVAKTGKLVASEQANGKMFGVLVVKDQLGDLGYLSAYSGKVANRNDLPGFVPPIFDLLQQDCYFQKEFELINKVNSEYDALKNSPTLIQLENKLNQETNNFALKLAEFKQQVVLAKAKRDADRAKAKETQTEQQFNELNTLLNQQSIIEKLKLRDLKAYWQARIDNAAQELNKVQQQLQSVLKTRKKLSNKLQKKIFAQYQFLNVLGAQKDLNDIFIETPFKVPPAGAGECAAPKLLQYAFLNNLTPIAMAEFWWGTAPKSQIRQHKNYYPSCYSKCQPILGHMLQGMSIDENPLLANPAKEMDLPIIYQDQDIVVVNKPSGLLSVPGKTIEDSVYTRIKAMFPHATGPLIVHRLDMSTSGIMVLTLNSRANKALQRQFIERFTETHYIAVVEGVVSQDEGKITLPLCLDIDDRPRQKVCFKTGKPAFTTYKVLERTDKTTRLQLFPKTGRTHQLRVHCAHTLGLNMPIVGDDHYGNSADRLHLHAQYLAFEHPITHKHLTFKVDSNF